MPSPSRRIVPLAVVALFVANVATLWIARGEFVCGWDTLGASFGVQALNQGSFLDGVRTTWTAILNQRGRPLFTGGESFLYGFLPGMLDNVWPWVLWGNLVAFALFTGVSAWLVRRLGARWWIFAGCVLASPALTSHSIVGLPDLPSNTLAYGLAIGWVLSTRPRGFVIGALCDVTVFVTITAIALQGYESAKTFFIIPAIAALTIKGIPVWRRLLWLGCAGAIAWKVHDLAAATTLGVVASIPHDPAAFARGVLTAARAYFLDTYIDFPALAVAAIIALPFLGRDRLFWTLLFVAVCGLVSINAFAWDGGFLVPHRFLLLGLVSALIVTLLLSGGAARRPELVCAALVALGMAYSTWVTVDFALRRPSLFAPNRVAYALPYNRAKADADILPDRIRDAITLARLGQGGPGHHIVLYGFSVRDEDSVNPQVLVGRVLLSLGYRRFTERFTFVDANDGVFIRFPIRKPKELASLLAAARTPFFLHVREPEHSADAVIAKYLNGARITPVDLGLLSNFRSFRVDAFTPPGPIPVPALPVTPAEGRPLAEGFCRIRWRQDSSAYSPVQHWDPSAPHIEEIVHQALDLAPREPRLYLDVARARVPAIAEPVPVYGVLHLRGYFDNEGSGPLLATLTVRAPDELAIVLNGLPIEENLDSRPLTEYQNDVLLPPGRSELVIFHHRHTTPGDVAVTSVDENGRALGWQCDADLMAATDDGLSAPSDGSAESRQP